MIDIQSLQTVGNRQGKKKKKDITTAAKCNGLPIIPWAAIEMLKECNNYCPPWS